MTDFIQKDKKGKLIGLTINGNYYKMLDSGRFYSLNSMSYLTSTERNE